MRRAAAAVAVFAAGVFLVALSGHGSGDGAAQAAVKRAAITAADAESSRFIVTWTAPDSLDFPRVEMTEHGLMDYAHHRGLVSSWTGQQVLYDGDVAYMKWPVPWREKSPWVSVGEGLGGDDLLDLQERAMRNPIGLLEFLSGASKDTREARAELVRGTPTTHYEGKLDLQMVVDGAPAGRREELQFLVDVLAKEESTKIPFGVWVDGGGVTHRLRIDGPGTSVTIDYFDFGAPVEIAAPPADETISFDAFIQEIQQHTDDEGCGQREVVEDHASSESGGKADTTSETSDLGGTEDDGATDSGTPTVRICLYPARSK